MDVGSTASTAGAGAFVVVVVVVFKILQWKRSFEMQFDKLGRRHCSFGVFAMLSTYVSLSMLDTRSGNFVVIVDMMECIDDISASDCSVVAMVNGLLQECFRQ